MTDPLRRRITAALDTAHAADEIEHLTGTKATERDGTAREQDSVWDQFAGYAAWSDGDLPQPAPVSAEQAEANADDLAVMDFAHAMMQKMGAARAKGRSGWQTCSVNMLWLLLRNHVEKGDPRDVANIAMMIWHNSRGDTP
jgi:hypothetical protein